jgi:hypothetical protein
MEFLDPPLLRSANGLIHFFASWVPFCNNHGTIPISYFPTHVLHAGVVDGFGPVMPLS